MNQFLARDVQGLSGLADTMAEKGVFARLMFHPRFDCFRGFCHGSMGWVLTSDGEGWSAVGKRLKVDRGGVYIAVCGLGGHERWVKSCQKKMGV